MSGTWGTITDPEWSSDDGQVVCRTLGYFTPGLNLPLLFNHNYYESICHFSAIISLIISGAVQYSDAYFGEGSGPIHLDRVVCAGTEYNLRDCETGLSNREIGHSQDVGVKCQTSERCDATCMYCEMLMYDPIISIVKLYWET